ncbi:hypothetical protein KRP22_004785 [Phytophthora ramorum]|nr:hypothetical protein KRP22_10416 [Phytophthora ramorum]
MSTRPDRSGSIQSGRAPTYPRKSLTFKSYRPPQEQRRGGLAIQGSRGKQNVLFTDQQMADDLLASVPKLHAAISTDARGSSVWHRKSRKDGVATYALVPSTDGSDDLDLAYASLAKTQIKCHLNEVLNVLISHESSDYQSTMSALCGDKFRDGRVVFQQRCRFSEGARQTLSGPDTAQGQKVLISVNQATLQPTLRLKLQSKKHREPQKLPTESAASQSRRRRRHKSKSAKEPPKGLAEKVRWDIEHHLKQSLRAAEKYTQPENCGVADLERDYAFEFDGSRTRDPNHPLPPTPELDKESRRLQYITQSGRVTSSTQIEAEMMFRQVWLWAAAALPAVALAGADTFFMGDGTGNDAGKVSAADETPSSVNILQANAEGVEKTSTQQQQGESDGSSSPTTSPFFIALGALVAVCAVALAAVAYSAKKKKWSEKGECVTRSFDTFSSPTQSKAAIAKI